MVASPRDVHWTLWFRCKLKLYADGECMRAEIEAFAPCIGAEADALQGSDGLHQYLELGEERRALFLRHRRFQSDGTDLLSPKGHRFRSGVVRAADSGVLDDVSEPVVDERELADINSNPNTKIENSNVLSCGAEIAGRHDNVDWKLRGTGPEAIATERILNAVLVETLEPKMKLVPFESEIRVNSGAIIFVAVTVDLRGHSDLQRIISQRHQRGLCGARARVLRLWLRR